MRDESRKLLSEVLEAIGSKLQFQTQTLRLSNSPSSDVYVEHTGSDYDHDRSIPKHRDLKAAMKYHLHDIHIRSHHPFLFSKHRRHGIENVVPRSYAFLPGVARTLTSANLVEK